MEKKRNRNAIRSVNMIMNAYGELLKVTPMEKITVTSIVNKAGLNRSTFYAHFDCPNDVRKMLEKKLVDELMEKIDCLDFKGLMADPQPLLDIVAERLEERMDYLNVMLERYPTTEWMESIKEAIIERFMSDAEAEGSYENKDDLLINLRFFVGGYISLCRDYINNKISDTPSELSESLARTIAGGLLASCD
ncbi:MAG: TetR/AcrR family transcriptional regulator [Clostridiales bacterium]|nr:TetR/AcrR family transcriptional regulator [Clostridiales bacterium]